MKIMMVENQLMIEAESMNDAFELGGGVQQIRQSGVDYFCDRGNGLNSNPFVRIKVKFEAESK